ncbi:MAG TPA: SH3 domain-containing protein, partial [Candidatus Babeliaceae bacterium]|nr:SH3 domain-containing protein [Candidatus Babeliaceae bacterium]
KSQNLMVRIKLNILACCSLFFLFIKGEDSKQPHEQLVELRKAQRYVLYDDYCAIEKKIAELKQDGKESQKRSLYRSYIYIQKSFPHYFWQIMLLLSWSVIIVVVSLRMSFRYLFLLPSTVLFLLACCFLIPEYIWSLQHYAVVKSSSLNLRLSPSDDACVYKLLRYLDEVKILQQKGEWMRICQAGAHGWVKQGELEIMR